MTRRRKRKYQGATWAPASQGVDLHDGAWCRRCKMRHGYTVMKVTYSQTYDGVFLMLWACPVTGDVIEEMPLIRKPKEEGEALE